MGLTIHYDLTTCLTHRRDLRTLVETVRQFARAVPFQHVSERLEFTGPEADFQQTDRTDEHRWFKIQASQYVESGDRNDSVPPRQIIGFSTQPGDGCEPANFGFGRYPTVIDVPSASGRTRRLTTGLDGWRWSSFCKTQYASSPDCGGVANFLRCHWGVIQLLDFLRATGLVSVAVQDESGYWEHRDLGRLASTVGAGDEFVAACAGQLHDQAKPGGRVVASAILGVANLEHIEAQCLERLAALRRRTGADG